MPTTAASYDGICCLLQNSCAHFADGTRRRVHSPSWATSSRVTSLTAVRGSTNPSTPRRSAAHVKRWSRSIESDARTCVEPVRAASRAGPLILTFDPRRKRSIHDIGTSVPSPTTSRGDSDRPVAGGRCGLTVQKCKDGPVADTDFDVLILGAGSGGYACALRAAQLGLRVGLVEKGPLGGTCLHVGCIPTKALLHAAEVADSARESAQFGVRATCDGIDMAAVNSYKDGVVGRLFKGLSGLIASRGITVIEGEGTMTGPHEVTVVSTGSTDRRTY